MNWTKQQEWVAALALGALDPDEAGKCRERMAWDPALVEEFSGFCGVLAGIVGPAKVSVPPGLRERVLNHARAHPRVPPASSSPSTLPSAPSPQSSLNRAEGFRFVFQDSAGWHATPIRGLRVRTLSVSRDMGYVVRLAELAPGTVYPEHDHLSSEELLVLQGNLLTEGKLLGPGDFLHAEPGTHHGSLMSPDGCVALLITKATGEESLD